MRALHLCSKILRRWPLRRAAYISSTSSNRSQDNTDVKWLWKLNETHMDYHRANLSGTMIGTFIVTFNTAKPLSASVFRETVGHLQRKIPHLRTCMRVRGDSFWFCQPSVFQPSFQVVNHVSNTREVIDDMVRNLLKDPETSSFETRVVFQRDDALGQIPEVLETHPHQYTFLCTTYHSLMDGLGFAYMVTCFIKILLNIMRGETVDDEQYVSFYEEKEIPALLSHFRQRLIEDEAFSKAVRETLPPPDFTPLILEVYPRPKPAVTTSKFLTGVLEPESFSYFKRRCKSEDVTLNSFLLAIINIAVMELARKNGIIRDNYMISPYIATSFRRYKRQSSEIYLGPCVGVLSFRSIIDANTKNNFWKYCKAMQNDIHSNLEEGLPLHQGVLRALINQKQSYDYISNLRPIPYDYGISNMGDLTYLVPKNDLIKVTEIRSMLFNHNHIPSSFHEIMSYNNRLYYTLGYPTNCLSDETAKSFFDEIFSLFEYVSKNSNLQ